MNPCVKYLLVLLCLSSVSAQSILRPIARRVPPIGIEIPDSVKQQTLARLSNLETELRSLEKVPAADVDVLLKAVRLAVTQREIYKPSQLPMLTETLDLAEERIEKLRSGNPDWTHQRLTVRGFYSEIDDSPQPYGLVIPENLKPKKLVPLYVWLHGRGDKKTDIHFIKERLSKVGQISPKNAIVLHPFGRQCLGFKSAGETDVLEAIQQVKIHYPIDVNRVVLMGFSMGGAGAWHIGAHYTDKFAAVSPGAGFAETAQYLKLSPEKIAATPAYERLLWGAYDVPAYVRNLFNVPIVCYSGENDKQIQAARVMETAFEQNGRKLEHIIGPDMGHKYHQESLSQIMSKMQRAIAKDTKLPQEVFLQTRTLRYPKIHWIRIERLAKHWNDSTVHAKIEGSKIICTTSNVNQLTIQIPHDVVWAVIDGVKFRTQGLKRDRLRVSRDLSRNTDWQVGPLDSPTRLAKRPGLQGPIDDAFMGCFLVVTPTGKSSSEVFDEWTKFELQHLRDRWSALFRGRLPEKAASEVSSDDIRDCNLILFGDEKNNELIKRVTARLPAETMTELRTRTEKAGPNCIPQMIHPNPLSPLQYVVLNSGPTFRESHDRTNSLQNPKLPDWAIIDLTTPPDDERAGKVIDAGFFDENWRFQ